MTKFIPTVKTNKSISAEIEESLYEEARLHMKSRGIKMKDVIELAFKNFIQSCNEENKKVIKKPVK